MKKQNKNNDWFTSVELAPNIWGIAEFGHNEKVISYLIVGKNQALLFDTGMGMGDIKQIVKQITNLPILVLNSHTHFDHIGNNHLFEDIIIFDHTFSKNNAKCGYSHQFLLEPANVQNFTQFPPLFNPNTYAISPFIWQKHIKEGDIIEICPFRFIILHTPGHSPDSICLYEKERGLLFVGDTLYEGPIYLQLPESNFLQYQRSIKRLSELSNLKMIFSAHNGYVFPIEKLLHICSMLSRFSNKKIRKNKLIIDTKTSLLFKYPLY